MNTCHTPTPKEHPSNLPPPAVKLAQRLAMLAKRGGLVTGQIVIVNGVWYFQLSGGKAEELGDG